MSSMSMGDLTSRASDTVNSVLGSRKDIVQDAKDWFRLQVKHGKATLDRIQNVCGKTQRKVASLSRTQQLTILVLALLLLLFLFLDLRQDSGVFHGVVFPCLRPITLVVYHLFRWIFYVLYQACYWLAYLLYSVIALVVRGFYKAVVFVVKDLLNVVHTICSGLVGSIGKVLGYMWSNAVGLLKALLFGGVVVCVVVLANPAFRERFLVWVGPLVDRFQELAGGQTRPKKQKDSKRK
ncbi:hypothetical protein V1264_007746 [Littorina saxatilis]|uniref:Uncharacterized protein n=1 Tax=Littorina saxatilis TaxID=31220 RepID=A0AAN9AW07_9CAEN